MLNRPSAHFVPAQTLDLLPVIGDDPGSGLRAATHPRESP
jgi:hypothetical protein